MARYGYHDLCLLFPPADDKTLDEMAADIKENGLSEPIYLYEGKILDGRNRYLACERAKVKPTFKEYVGEDPLSFVISKNLYRRHLTDSQRAMLARKILEERGEDVIPDERKEIASQFEVSQALIRRAERVCKLAITPITELVKNGEMSITKAESIITDARDRTDSRIVHDRIHPADQRKFRNAQEKLFKTEILANQPPVTANPDPEFSEEMLTGVFEAKKYRRTVADIQAVIAKIAESPALFAEASNVVGALDQEKLLVALLSAIQKTVKDVLKKVQIHPISYDKILEYTTTILNERFKLPEVKYSDEHEFLVILKDQFIANCEAFLEQVTSIRRRIRSNGKFNEENQ